MYTRDAGHKPCPVMETLTIPYPEEILTESGETPEEFEREMRVLVAAKLYEMGRVTSGRAAEMAGMERVPFLNELERYHVSMLNYSSEELEREIKEAKRRAQTDDHRLRYQSATLVCARRSVGAPLRALSKGGRSGSRIAGSQCSGG